MQVLLEARATGRARRRRPAAPSPSTPRNLEALAGARLRAHAAGPQPRGGGGAARRPRDPRRRGHPGAAGARAEGPGGRAGHDRAAARPTSTCATTATRTRRWAARSCAPWSATTRPWPSRSTTSRQTTIPVILFTPRGATTTRAARPPGRAACYDGLDGRIRIPIGGLTTRPHARHGQTLIHELTHAFVADRTRGVGPARRSTRGWPSTWRASAWVEQLDAPAAHGAGRRPRRRRARASTWARCRSWST